MNQPISIEPRHHKNLRFSLSDLKDWTVLDALINARAVGYHGNHSMPISAYRQALATRMERIMPRDGNRFSAEWLNVEKAYNASFYEERLINFISNETFRPEPISKISAHSKISKPKDTQFQETQSKTGHSIRTTIVLAETAKHQRNKPTPPINSLGYSHPPVSAAESKGIGKADGTKFKQIRPKIHPFKEPSFNRVTSTKTPTISTTVKTKGVRSGPLTIDLEQAAKHRHENPVAPTPKVLYRQRPQLPPKKIPEVRKGPIAPKKAVDVHAGSTAVKKKIIVPKRFIAPKNVRSSIYIGRPKRRREEAEEVDVGQPTKISRKAKTPLN